MSPRFLAAYLLRQGNELELYCRHHMGLGSAIHLSSIADPGETSAPSPTRVGPWPHKVCCHFIHIIHIIFIYDLQSSHVLFFCHHRPVPVSSLSESCPIGDTYPANISGCFQLSKNIATWQEAKASCPLLYLIFAFPAHRHLSLLLPDPVTLASSSKSSYLTPHSVDHATIHALAHTPQCLTVRPSIIPNLLLACEATFQSALLAGSRQPNPRAIALLYLWHPWKLANKSLMLHK